jgi:hypothetical protein
MKTANFRVLILIVLLSCNNSPNKNSNPIITDTAKVSESQKRDTLETDYYKPLLDSFPFEKYKVNEIYNGRIAKLDLSYYSDSPYDIRSTIRDHYNQIKKSNFAGHYILFSWGCGSPCQMNAIVDAITGKTILTFNTSWGVDFQPDSYLLIQEPPLQQKYDKAERETLGKPEFDIFKDNKLIALTKK